jgi:hypothetical protein
MVIHKSSPGVYLIRVAKTCAHGARVAVVPASAATIVRTAKAADGRPVVIAVRPNSLPARFTIRTTSDTGVQNTVRVAQLPFPFKVVHHRPHQSSTASPHAA